MLIVMSVGPGESKPGESREAPPLPPMLLQVWPVIVVGFLGWLVATAAAFVVPALQSWRPVTLAGLGTGLIGTGIFVLQLAAARRGARGAQAGLENYLDHK
jgi:protein-S-isoprenylcysteine O-methyltransferase Ste14